MAIDALDIDRGYAVEQNIPMAERAINEGISNSPEEIIRAKHVLDSMAPNSVEKNGPGKRADIEDIRRKISTTKAENKEGMLASIEDHELLEGNTRSVDYMISEDGQHMIPVLKDLAGKVLDKRSEHKIPIEDFLGAEDNIVKNQYSRVGEKYIPIKHSSDVRSAFNLRQKMSLGIATSDERVSLDISKLSQHAEAIVLAGEAKTDVPHRITRGNELNNTYILSAVENIVNEGDIDLPEVTKLMGESEGMLGRFVQHIVSEEHTQNPVGNLLKAKERTINADKSTDLDSAYVNRDVGLMQVNLKPVMDRGGSPYEAANFQLLNPLANLAEGMLVIRTKAKEINAKVKSAGLGPLDEVQAAAALTAAYNGGSKKINKEWIKAVKGDKSAKPVNLGNTSFQFVAINSARQIQTALVYDTNVAGFDALSKSPDSVAARLWNMKITTKGKTMTAGEWIKAYKNKRGEAPYYNNLRNEYNKDFIHKHRNVYQYNQELKNAQDLQQSLPVDEGKRSA